MRMLPMARLLTLSCGIAAVAVIAACEGEEKEGKGGERKDVRNDRAQVTETDVLQCGMSGTLLDNRTTNAYNVHVRVKNDCSAMIEDTLRPPADDAHLKVLDLTGAVVGGIDITIPAHSPPWRGVVPVPAGARLVLECGRRAQWIVNKGCSWSYSYSP